MPSPSTNGLIDPHLSAVPADRLFQQLSSTKPPVPHSPTIKPSIHSSITNNETGTHPSDCIEYLIYKLRLHYVPLYFSASCTENDEIHSLKQRAIIYCDQLQLLLKGEFLSSRYSPAPGSIKYSLRKLHKAYNKLDQTRIECDSIHRVTELWPEGAKIRARYLSILHTKGLMIRRRSSGSLPNLDQSIKKRSEKLSSSMKASYTRY